MDGLRSLPQRWRPFRPSRWRVMGVRFPAQPAASTSLSRCGSPQHWMRSRFSHSVRLPVLPCLAAGMRPRRYDRDCHLWAQSGAQHGFAARSWAPNNVMREGGGCATMWQALPLDVMESARAEAAPAFVFLPRRRRRCQRECERAIQFEPVGHAERHAAAVAARPRSVQNTSRDHAETSRNTQTNQTDIHTHTARTQRHNIHSTIPSEIPTSVQY